MTAPSVAHERRAGVLDALAVLAGFSVELTCWPDGTRPDVLRADVARRRLFVGEAKETESPGRTDTAERLARYLGWVAAARADLAYVAVCFGRHADRRGWIRLLEQLSRPAGVDLAFVACWTFDATHHVIVVDVRAVFRASPPRRPAVTSPAPLPRFEREPACQSRSASGSRPRLGLNRARASTSARTRASGRSASAAD